MVKFNTIDISLDMAKPGMILAKDIYNSRSLTLVSADTELTDRHIEKLKFYGISNIAIKNIVPESLKTLNHEGITPAFYIKTPKKFKELSSAYSKSQDKFKSLLLDISDGHDVEVSDLFDISHNIIKNIEYKSKLFGFLSTLQSIDDYTYRHSINVSVISYIFGQWVGLSKKALKELAVAGLLHDIGKTKIPNTLLNKPGKLTPEEFNEIKKHTVYGFKIIEKQKLPRDIKMAVLMHHEKYDGSGYPLHVTNDQINMYTKIISIADIYDAMTSDRPYRNKFTPFHVISDFEGGYYGKLDTKYLMIFLNNIAYCYLDNWCILSNGKEAKIVFVNKNFPSKPIVQVNNTLIDLSEEKDLFIEELI